MIQVGKDHALRLPQSIAQVAAECGHRQGSASWSHALISCSHPQLILPLRPEENSTESDLRLAASSIEHGGKAFMLHCRNQPFQHALRSRNDFRFAK
jgi:hypothetical protein